MNILEIVKNKILKEMYFITEDNQFDEEFEYYFTENNLILIEKSDRTIDIYEFQYLCKNILLKRQINLQKYGSSNIKISESTYKTIDYQNVKNVLNKIKAIVKLRQSVVEQTIINKTVKFEDDEIYSVDELKGFNQIPYKTHLKKSHHTYFDIIET